MVVLRGTVADFAMAAHRKLSRHMTLAVNFQNF